MTEVTAGRDSVSVDAAQRDARMFLDTLFERQPPDTVIAIGDVRKPRFVYSPADALSYVVGKHDVYVRVTLLARRPENGRGTAADSVAIPGVWCELDVNGGPTSNGKLIEDGAESVADAIRIAHLILEPTLIVQSGYGVHAYWLFEDPWLLDSDSDRQAAHDLVQGWQERLRIDSGIGIDSTQDLARVLRVPGSFNCKLEPVPVVLASNGGARYPLQEIGPYVVHKQPARATRASGDIGEIIERHDDLAKIVTRNGTKPGDGTGHAWDFMLGCRAAEHGYDDAVLGELIRHARRTHGEGKGERDDYVERPIAAVRERVGYVAAGAARDEILAELTNALGLGAIGRKVAGTHVVGHGNTAVASIVLADGYSIEFPSFEHVAQPGKLADQLATTVGIATDFNKLQSRRVAALVRQASSRREEFREREIYVDEAARLLWLAQKVEFKLDDQADRWKMWTRVGLTDPEEAREGEAIVRRDTAEAYARRMLIPCDTKSGVRFVHAGWFQQFMRLRLGPGSTPQRARQAIRAPAGRPEGKTGGSRRQRRTDV